MSVPTNQAGDSSAAVPDGDGAHWNRIEDETEEIPYNIVSKGFLAPPLDDRQLEVLNALVYTREEPKRVFHGYRAMPGELNVDNDLTKEHQIEDAFPCQIVQVSNIHQFVEIGGDFYQINGCSWIGDRDENSFIYEARIKFDTAKPIEDEELIQRARSLLS